MNTKSIPGRRKSIIPNDDIQIMAFWVGLVIGTLSILCLVTIYGGSVCQGN